MVMLSRAVQSELLDLLTPLMQREEDRRGLLHLALGMGCPVLDQIDYRGAAEPFALRAIERLAGFGTLEDGTTALWALMETAKGRLGVDRQARIDDLRPLLEAPAPQAGRPVHAEGATPPLPLRIFLASPGDVADERASALQVLVQLQYDPLLRGRITVETVAWDQPGASPPLLATETPQASIAQGRGRPSECDIVIVVLWAHMGTPLPSEWKRPDGAPYRSGTEWEYLDALQAAEADGRPDILVYRRSEEPSLKPSDSAFMEKYQQWQQVERFFASFRLPDGSIQRGYNRYATPEDFRRQLNLHLRELIRRRLDTRPAAPMRPPLASVAQPQPPALWKGSPFPGLRALTPEDAPIFCGRGRETQELLHKITDAETRFVAVVGASGSGKSSLVAAGLLPALLEHTAKAPWRWARFTPGQSGAHPLRALAQALAEISAGHRTEALEERLFSGPEALTGVVADILHDDQKSAALPEAELLVFIDQFEELFTLVDPVLRSPFIHWLTAAARAPRLRIVITLRADFYAQCVEWQVLAELLRTGSYPLAAPHLGALYEMITGPAERAGLGFEAGLVAQLLQDTGTEPGALALLAFALGELYDHRSEEGRLTWDVYRAFGGVQGVIAQRADAIYHSLDADESTLGRVFGELVEVDQRGTATRRRVPLARVQRSQAASALVEALTAGRLLVRGRDEQDLPTVEVAHEALFRKWDTLQGWIESMADELRLLRQVRQAALDWSDHDRSEAYLWPHERLEPVWAAVEHLEPELDGLTREFLRPEQDRLLAELNDIATDHKRRSDIGERLAVIGDPRPGVGLREDGLPDIVWCEVPAGEVTLEDGAGSFAVPRCWIAKYPVTYLQYRSFLKAPDGFPDARVWKGLERETEAWVQNRKFANHPADNIRWFGAVAFCRWLDTRVGAEIRARFGAQYIIRLPTEWEWLQAATGGDSGNVYPWGPEWDSRRANIYESGLSRTTAVGMYPQGASPVGPLDMAGNLWEWCLNEYEAPSNTGLSGDGRRVVRGGSWDSFQDDARAAYRASNAPVSRNNSLGFR